MTGARHPDRARAVRATVRDVAQQSGVSTATVSRVINGNRSVSDGARARVQTALATLGYTPNRLAASLRLNRTGLIGLVIGEPGSPTEYAAIQGAWMAATPAHYNVVVYLPYAEGMRDTQAYAYLAPGWVDGALLLYTPAADGPSVLRLQHSGLPLVQIDPEVPHAGIPAVYPDHYYDGHGITRYLLELRHRRIALCADGVTHGLDRRYLDGYRAALDAAGIAYDAALERTSGSSYDVGYTVARDWLELPDPPTAMVFHSDMAAMGAIASARDAGRRVPEDVSVIGFDDTQMARWIKPALTTPRERLLGLTRAAGTILLGLLAGEDPPTEPLLVRTDLVIRQSSGPAPA